MKKTLMLTATILVLTFASSIQALTCCMSTHVSDQAVVAANQGFTDIVIDSNGTCDTAGISWTFMSMRMHYTYRLLNQDLITTNNTTINGMPYQTNIDTVIGWCSTSIENADLTAFMPNMLTTSPNPCKTQTTVQFANPGAKARLELFNAAGSRVFVQDKITGSSMAINMTGLVKGNYIIRVKTDCRIFMGKIIKQ